jgi:hypothetical protein
LGQSALAAENQTLDQGGGELVVQGRGGQIRQKLGPGSCLPSGQAATYADPSDGSPDILTERAK